MLNVLYYLAIFLVFLSFFFTPVMDSRSWRRSKTQIGRAGSWKNLLGRWKSVRGNWRKKFCLLLYFWYWRLLELFYGILCTMPTSHSSSFPEKGGVVCISKLCVLKSKSEMFSLLWCIMQTLSIQYDKMSGIAKAFPFRVCFWFLCWFPLSLSTLF